MPCAPGNSMESVKSVTYAGQHLQSLTVYCSMQQSMYCSTQHHSLTVYCSKHEKIYLTLLYYPILWVQIVTFKFYLWNWSETINSKETIIIHLFSELAKKSRRSQSTNLGSSGARIPGSTWVRSWTLGEMRTRARRTWSPPQTDCRWATTHTWERIGLAWSKHRCNGQLILFFYFFWEMSSKIISHEII